ncbi:MAG: hypothetical protein JW829_01565 [Pirellulales bacterium]|nr:hypothetical protein [Pirellulales bacterium]
MSHEQLYEVDDADYRGSEFGRTERIRTPQQRRPSHRRQRGKTPQSFNGIHRRRRRKITW